ncbi:TetR/AcrR family transcriptional regulator [Devosia sp.]|uniref:TetR/AcrR family transcriptional regulator n=1 Tax=Devosia sp. TaxID=1871048 RepID=UPI00262B2B52|nr:TetR/AcrR family transcriptional regulator [Devosia sp.]
MSTSPVSGRYHHGDLRRALLEAAMDMLEAEGAAGLGLRELARLVGVSAAAPYRHFDSKTSLLETLAITGYQRFSTMMGEAERDSPPERRIAMMGQAYVNFALANPNLFRLMFSPELKRDNRPGLRMAADAAFDTLRAVTAALPEGDKRIAALKAWAQVHGLAVLLLDGQIARRDGEDIEAMIAAVLADKTGSLGA